MSTDELYVVYSQVTDEILSVHSTRSFALMARADKVRDAISRYNKICAYQDEDTITRLKMKYVTATLSEAIGWLTSTPDFVQE